METSNFTIQSSRSEESSYRTYEEWKHNNASNIIIASKSSYRTYEEWKQKVRNYKSLIRYRSYRTYEEWKLSIMIHLR